jgi:hypothetical protein
MARYPRRKNPAFGKGAGRGSFSLNALEKTRSHGVTTGSIIAVIITLHIENAIRISHVPQSWT